MKTLTKTTSFRIPSSLHHALVAKSKSLKIHPSELIREAIASWVGRRTEPANNNPVAVLTQQKKKINAKKR